MKVRLEPQRIPDGGTVVATVTYDPDEVGDLLISADDDHFQVSPPSHTPDPGQATELVPLTIKAAAPLRAPKICFLTFTRGGPAVPGAVNVDPKEGGP